MSLKFCFIGAGNLATHLSKALYKNGYAISQVYSRTKLSAETLAANLNTEYTILLKEIKNADIYFIALKDSVIDEVLSQIDFRNKLIIHCSGSLPLSVLSKYSTNYGVLYPLQTFSKNRKVDFNTIPIFIESNSKENEYSINKIASEISNNVSILNSEKRKLLHISAVFTCNFVNHLYAISSEILKSKNIPFDVLKPLILETAQKVQEIEPQDAQTGPAVRFDENIISSHLKELEGNKNYVELYNSISKSIFEHHKKQ
ncbi:MAG: DUF2520 domain-containing protein [Bacteroidetes bacterium]|nr:DUF2520 domain-containing protein [Bacteroidota bacterium]